MLDAWLGLEQWGLLGPSSRSLCGLSPGWPHGHWTSHMGLNPQEEAAEAV